jgi:hypothetical protein
MGEFQKARDVGGKDGGSLPRGNDAQYFSASSVSSASNPFARIESDKFPLCQSSISSEVRPALAK